MASASSKASRTWPFFRTNSHLPEKRECFPDGPDARWFCQKVGRFPAQNLLFTVSHPLQPPAVYFGNRAVLLKRMHHDRSAVEESNDALVYPGQGQIRLSMFHLGLCLHGVSLTPSDPSIISARSRADIHHTDDSEQTKVIPEACHFGDSWELAPNTTALGLRYRGGSKHCDQAADVGIETTGSPSVSPGPPGPLRQYWLPK